MTYTFTMPTPVQMVTNHWNVSTDTWNATTSWLHPKKNDHIEKWNNGWIDFQKIIFVEELKPLEYGLCQDHSSKSLCDYWRKTEAWGVPWNASSNSFSRKVWNDDRVIVSFTTPWHKPIHIERVLLEVYPDSSIM